MQFQLCTESESPLRLLDLVWQTIVRVRIAGMPAEQSVVYRFAGFEVNPVTRTLKHNEAFIVLSRRSFDLLLYFVQNSGKILSKEELLRNIWAEAFVDENSLTKTISVLRKALDDASAERSFVLTLPGRGYQFAASVKIVSSENESAQALAELDDEIHSVGILQQRRTVRTSISRVQRGGVQWSARAAIALALGITIVAAAVTGGGYLLWRHFHPAAQSASVVLADFENTTGEKDFDFAVNKAFQIELEQSPFLDILPRTTVKDTLVQMQRKADEPLTPELAREVCERNNAQAVISGSISNFAGKYLLIMSASSCVTGKSVAGNQQLVSQKADVLPALDAAAGRIRKQLGESAASLQKFRTPIAQATTSSLEALRDYTQGLDASDRGDDTTAQTLFQRAIALDGNFASAYKALSVILYNSNEYSVAYDNIQKAYTLRDHTTERERLVIEFAYNAFGTYDYQSAIAALRLSNQLYPNNASNWANLCSLYTQVGNYPQAIAAGESGWRLAPNSGPRAMLLARAYKRANRFADAKRVAAITVANGTDGFSLHSILFQIAVAEHDAVRAKAEGDWGLAHGESARALEDLGNAAASEGKLGEAAGDFSRARLDAARTGENEFADSLSIELADLLVDAGDTHAAAATLRNQAGNGGDSMRFAVLKAKLGDMGPARKLLAEEGKSGETNTIHRYYDLPMMRALLALNAHQPAQAVQELELARLYQMRDFKVLSLRARAETEAGMLDRAEEDLRLILANPGIDPIAPLYNVAHLRLARVLAAQKKFEPARKEYEAFLDAWKDADPQLPLLLQAKNEYAKLPPH